MDVGQRYSRADCDCKEIVQGRRGSLWVEEVGVGEMGICEVQESVGTLMGGQTRFRRMGVLGTRVCAWWLLGCLEGSAWRGQTNDYRGRNEKCPPRFCHAPPSPIFQFQESLNANSYSNQASINQDTNSYLLPSISGIEDTVSTVQYSAYITALLYIYLLSFSLPCPSHHLSNLLCPDLPSSSLLFLFTLRVCGGQMPLFCGHEHQPNQGQISKSSANDQRLHTQAREAQHLNRCRLLLAQGEIWMNDVATDHSGGGCRPHFISCSP